MSIVTKRPWSDEGWFASAGFTLATKGYMGTPVMEETSIGLTGINQRTYWVLPAYFLVQAAWYKLVGFSLFSMRALSLLCGLVSIACWHGILLRLAGRFAAAIGTVLLATDYYFVQAGSFGRYDMLCLTLGSLSIWLYLRLRETHFTAAILLSHVFACAAGLTHFLGVMLFLWLVMLTLVLDHRRITFSLCLACMVPYLAGGGLWFNYIRENPEHFRAQFLGTAVTAGRVSGILTPFNAFLREISERYLIGYGLGTHSAAHSGPIWIKSFILLAWLVGLAVVLGRADLRRRVPVRMFAVLVLLQFVIMTYLDGHKQTWYLVYMTVPFAALLAIAAEWSWTHWPRLRWFVATGLAGLVMIQTGGSLLRSRINVYENQFLPAARFLTQPARDGKVIMASAELGFGIGFDSKLTDDTLMGYHTQLRPDFIVQESNWTGIMEIFRTERPAVFAHMKRLLEDEYQVVYDQNGYKIWERLAVPRKK